MNNNIRLNILVGPPRDKSRDAEALELFLDKADVHAVCGGSTCAMVSAYVGSPLILEAEYPEEGLMTFGYIGDMVATEGVMTLCAVAEYFSGRRSRPGKETGAGLLIGILEEACSVRIIFGTARNTQHFGEISFARKEKSLMDIKTELEKLGKKAEIIKF